MASCLLAFGSVVRSGGGSQGERVGEACARACGMAHGRPRHCDPDRPRHQRQRPNASADRPHRGPRGRGRGLCGHLRGTARHAGARVPRSCHDPGGGPGGHRLGPARAACRGRPGSDRQPVRPLSRSPGSRPAISAPAFPGRPVPGKSPGPPGRMYGNARSTQRLTSSRNPRPARPVRGRPWKADGAHRPSQGPDAVRYTSVDTATQRSTAIQGDTWRDREETARIAENFQLAGRFRRWWQVLGSNQRRLSRRFYRPLPLATRATCRVPPELAAQRRIAQDETGR